MHIVITSRQFKQRCAMQDTDTGLWFVNEYSYVNGEKSVSRDTIADELTEDEAYALELQRPDWEVVATPRFNRDDICAAYQQLDFDYNVSPSYRKKTHGIEHQINRMGWYDPRCSTGFWPLNENALAIYRALEKRFGFVD